MNYQKSMIKSVVTYLHQHGVKILVLFALVVLLLFMLLPKNQTEPSYVNVFESAESIGTKESFQEPDQANLAAIPTSDEDIEEIVNQQIYVDIKGAVNHPDMYILPVGSRVYDVIEKAGGVTPEAATDYINQAKLLEDQMLIYIQTQEEIDQGEPQNNIISEHGVVQGGQGVEETSSPLVNINEAMAEELMLLPNIGQKKAEAIIQFRQEEGSFTIKEDIMNVSGIGVKTFEKLADLITVTP